MEGSGSDLFPCTCAYLHTMLQAGGVLICIHTQPHKQASREIPKPPNHGFCF
jgi:hypothetical protein